MRPAGDDARADVAAGDGADPGHPEDLPDLGLAGDDLFELRGQQADHGLLDVLEDLVDDLVGPDLDVLGLGQLPGLAVRADVEADDRGVGRGGQRDVVLGDAADGAVHERQLDVVALQLAQALGERLERALHVGLEDQVERGGLALLDLLKMSSSLTPFWTRASARWFLTRARCSRASATVRAVFSSGATRNSSPASGTDREAEHLHRRRRTGLLDLVALVVDQRPHRAPGRAGHDRVADLERALVDEDGGHRATADVEVGLEHDALGPARSGWP